jgi:hypothetical protein
MGFVSNLIGKWPDTVKKFGSMREFEAYWQDHPEVTDSVSPGGAASRLGVSRQRVYDMIKQGHLRAWMIYDCEVGGCYDVPGNRASFIFVSSPDIEAYLSVPKSKGGRPVGWRKAAA